MSSIHPDIKNDQIAWSIVRILSTLIVILIVDIVFLSLGPYILTMINLVIVWVLDLVDSVPMKIKYGRNYLYSDEYQIDDKINDIIIYFFVLEIFYILQPELDMFMIFFTLAFLYRLVGVILYIRTKDDKYIIYFSNFFGEVPAIFIFMKYILKFPNYVYIPITILLLVLKVGYEYFHHKIWRYDIQGYKK